MSLLRRKSLDSVTVHEAGRRLVPTLSWPHLIALGIGAIVGTGIYTLIGVGADRAGPAVLISFAIAGRRRSQPNWVCTHSRKPTK